MELLFIFVFSQSKASKMVADISVSGTKLHVSYSDGTSKDMDMPPSLGVQFKYFTSHGSNYVGLVTYDTLRLNTTGAAPYLTGTGPNLSFYYSR